MKNRITTGWTWTRGIFLLIGSWMIIQAALEGEWLGIVLGAWLAAMGVFGLGCASGNCYNGNCEVKPEKENKEK